MTTRNEVAERYGPQTTQIEALLDRARNLSKKETKALRVAWDAREARDAWDAWDAGLFARAAAWSACDAAWDAAQAAARAAAWDTWDVHRAVRDAARYAVEALVVRDLVGQNGFTQEHYDTLVALWETVMGTTWTREAL